ncbi:MAG: AsmA family protein [Burkholderiales bacterium]|nr:AsmA family protein [Burkholderiales bacterium]
MKARTKFIGGVLLGLVAVAATAPWWVPTGAWKGPLEAAASQALDAPVTIGDIDVFLLPLPHAAVRAVDVGGGALRLDAATVRPDLLSLLSSPRRLKSVELRALEVTPQGLALLQRLAERAPAGPPAVELAHLQARAVKITLAAGPLPALDATVALGAQNQPQSVRVATVDGKATLTAEPDGEGWKVALAANGWALPLGPPLVLDELSASGRADRERLTLPTVQARLYGGRAGGSVEVAWAKGVRMAGKAEVSGLDIAPLLQALKVKASLAGQLQANGSFRAQAPRAAALADAFNAEFAFKVDQGVLRGFDLASAAKTLVKGGSGGGETRFDQFTGNVQLAGRAVRLRNLKVASGVLDARGNIDVSPARALGGRVEVDLKGTGGLVGVPLAVSGTVADPVVLPTKGALAGAAVGTVLLPGVGTSLGSSVGDRLGRMFGK